MRLKDLDKKYCESINSTVTTLKESAEEILKTYSFDLTKTEISEAILIRLKTYYVSQQDIKKILNKRYQTAGADFFVETVIFFLQLYFQKQGGKYSVHSERQVKKKKNAIRPDISIWKGDEVVAIIECKTQLGWNRNNWEHDFKAREKKLQADFPNASAFLLVMTGLNWGGFGDNKDLRNKYFCLLKDIWITQYEDIKQLYTKIEGLLERIK
jgi:hypothetical protein